MSGARDTLNQPRDIRVDTDGRQMVRRVDATGIDVPVPTNTSTAALITHAAASVGVNGADQTNLDGRGLLLGINITAATGVSPTLQVIVEGKDAASGTYYPLLTSAAIVATAGFTLLSLYPGLAAVANLVASQVLPRVWRVRTVIGGASPAVTATIGANVSV